MQKRNGRPRFLTIDEEAVSFSFPSVSQEALAETKDSMWLSASEKHPISTLKTFDHKWLLILG